MPSEGVNNLGDGGGGASSSVASNESLTNLKRDRDGYFARLSHRLFSDPAGFFGTFADDQRLSRLDGCKAMDASLVDCKRVRQAIMNAEKKKAEQNVKAGGWFGGGSTGGLNETDDRMDSAGLASLDNNGLGGSSRGQSLKIARFYGWGVGGAGASGAEKEEEARAKRREEIQMQKPDDFDMAGVDDMGSTADSSGTVSIPTCSREQHSLVACRALALGCADHLVPLRKCLQRTGTEALHYNDDSPVSASIDEAGQCALEQRAIAKCIGANMAELDRRLKARQ